MVAIGLSTLIRQVWWRRWLLLGGLLLGGVVGFLWAERVPQVYRASGEILIDALDPAIPEIAQARGAVSPLSIERVRTEADLLVSRGAIEAVVRDLGLDRREAERPRWREWLSEQKDALLDLAAEHGLVRPREPVSADLRARRAFEKASVTVHRDIRLRLNNQSRVVRIDYADEDPEIAAGVINALMTHYLAQSVQAKQEVVQQANEWLMQRAAALAKEVEEADRRTQEFQQANGLMSLDRTGLPTYQLNQRMTQLAQVRDELARAEAALATAQQAQRGTAAAVETLNSQTIQRLRLREAEVVQRAGAMVRLGPAHPDRIAVESELRDIRRQIDGEIARISDSLRRDVELARARAKEAEARIAPLERRARSASASEVQLAALQREADARRDAYNAFLARAAQTQQTTQLPSGRIITRAMPPNWPGGVTARLAAIAGAAIGLFLATAFVLGRFLYQRRVISPSGLRTVTGVENLISIPKLPNRLLREGVVLRVQDQSSSVAETLRAFRLLVEEMCPPGEVGAGATVLVTSAQSGEGKSTTALSFARLCALDGQSVLLVEGDMRRPTLYNVVSPPRYTPLEEILEEGLPWREHVFRDRSGADMLIAGGKSLAPARLVDSAAMRRLLAEARLDYDLVIIDSAPVLSVTDPLILGRQSDLIAVVVASDRTPQDLVGEAIARFDAIGLGDRLRTLLTRVRPGRFGPHGYYAGYRVRSA